MEPTSLRCRRGPFGTKATGSGDQVQTVGNEDTMRHVLYVMLAVAIVGTFATSNLAISQGGTMVCRPGGNCLSTTATNYNRCVELALRRGLQLTKGDRHPFDMFVYDCVAGRVR
jgi:hypothetical protein